MIGVSHRAGRACAALALGAFALATIGAAPAAADPVAVVTPTDVVDGQTVELQLSGLDGAGLGATAQCSAEVLAEPSWAHCELRQIVMSPPALSSVVVRSVLNPQSANPIDCHVAPGCVVGYMTSDAAISAFAPVVFSPDLAPTSPQRNLTGGETVHVTAGGTPPAGATVAQCDKAILDDPTPAQADALCGASTPLVAQPGGGFGADLVVEDPFVSVSGADRTCGYDACVIVRGPVDGSSSVPNVAISFGPVTVVAVDPVDHVQHSQFVTIDLAGVPFEGTLQAFCALPLGPDLSSSQCLTPYSNNQQDRWGNLRTSVRAELTVGGPGVCASLGCGVAVADLSGNWLVPAVPVGMTWIDVTSGEGPYLHGDPITVEGEDLTPGREYLVQHCRITEECDEGVTVTVAADGVLDASIPAVQRYTSTSGTHYVCRERLSCSVLVTDLGTGVNFWRFSNMAVGNVAAAPDTGLTDGQTVQVTGTDLMPSYAGPVVWFPTGTWALTECDSEVMNGGVTLLGVFTHCAVLPPTTPVEIPGSTLDTTLDVDATITKILGGTTDCTTGPGRCVVGLVRWEQDATVTAHLTPITFGP